MKRKRLISGIISSLLTFSLFSGLTLNTVNANAPPTGYVAQTKTVTFGESTSQNGSQTVTIPYLANVKSVTVNTGNVSYTRSGSNLTINVSGGAVTRTSTPSKPVSSTSDQYTNSSFPSTKWYDDGTYRGNIGASGSPWVVSGNSPDSYWRTDYRQSWGNDLPGSLWYNDGTYSGTLNGQGVWTETVQTGGTYTAKQYLNEWKSGIFWWYSNDGLADFWNGAYGTTPDAYPNDWFGGSTGDGTNPAKPWDFYGRTNPSTCWEIDGYRWDVGTNTSSDKYAGIMYWSSKGFYIRKAWVQYRHFIPASDTRTWATMWKQNYGGTVYRPDTRTWRQNYSGTVYANTINYYAYTVTVTYEADPNASISLNTPTNSNNVVSLSWNTTDSSGQPYKYYLYRDGTLIASDFTSTTYSDYDALDNANPTTPTVSVNRQGSKVTATITSSDNGTAYSYYVVGRGQTYGNNETSNTVSTTTTSGMKEYYYKFSSSSTDNINGSNIVPEKNALLLNSTHNWSTFGYSGAGSTFAIGTNGWNGLNYGSIKGSGVGDTGVLVPVSGVTANTNYKASVKVKFPNGMTNAGNGTLFIVNGTNSVGISSVNPSGLSASNWTEISTTFNSGTNTSLIVRIDRGDAPEVQFTDLKIEPVDNYSTSTSNVISTILNDNSTNYLYVKSIDKQNNLSTISKVSIVIPAITPSVTATNGTSSATLNWSVNDTTQTYLYDVYRDGTKILSDVNYTSYTDTNAKDTTKPTAPSTVNIAQVMDYTLDYNKVNFSITAPTDNGTTYNYYVVAKGQIDAKNRTSATDSAVVTSGIKGYAYTIDNNSTATLNTTTINTSSTSFTVDKLAEGNLYLHIIAIDNNNNYSTTYNKAFTISELMQIKNLKLTNHIDKPTELTLPYSFPAGTPAPMKVGYNITFTVDTTNVDKLKVEYFINGTKVYVNNQTNTDTIITTGNRNLTTSTFTIYFDRSIPRDSIIDMKFTGTKNRADGTSKDFVENVIGDNSLKVVGSSIEEVNVNQTN